MQNKDNIKREIERSVPEVKASGAGHFPHYPKYRVVCYNALTAEEKVFYIE